VGCASGGGAPAAPAAPPTGALLKIELGMNDSDVRGIAGEPTSSKTYMTGKQFIPYYYGSDTSRMDWVYDGQGRVVFSRNRYSGGRKVIQVLGE
jgi:hypothetical protein